MEIFLKILCVVDHGAVAVIAAQYHQIGLFGIQQRVDTLYCARIKGFVRLLKIGKIQNTEGTVFMEMKMGVLLDIT